MNIFSDLKFRIGYGESGNNRIPSYTSLAVLGSLTYPQNNQTSPAYASVQIPNEELKWEANKTFNIGLDIGLFNQRLTLTPEYYVNKSVDLLLNAELPYSSGFTSMYQNVGKTENKGVDITVHSVNIQKKSFTWTTDLNISYNKNKVVALAGEQFFLRESGWGLAQTDYRIGIGEPIGQMYGYITEGLLQVDDFDYDPSTKKYTLKEGVPDDPNKTEQPGFWKFKDIAGASDENGNPIPDGAINADDRTVIGNGSPKFYGGINNTVIYKNFDFSVFFNFMIGNDVMNATKAYNSYLGLANKNALAVADSNNRWVTIDDNGSRISDPEILKELNQGKTVAQYYDMNPLSGLHSWAIEDGSFLRLNNISMGYTFSKSVLHPFKIDRLRLYCTANNLFVITNYSGFDPEVSTRNSSGLTPGVDWGAYPRSRTIVFGVNVIF